jgi:hypothetical protein
MATLPTPWVSRRSTGSTVRPPHRRCALCGSGRRPGGSDPSRDRDDAARTCASRGDTSTKWPRPGTLRRATRRHHHLSAQSGNEVRSGTPAPSAGTRRWSSSVPLKMTNRTPGGGKSFGTSHSAGSASITPLRWPRWLQSWAAALYHRRAARPAGHCPARLKNMGSAQTRHRSEIRGRAPRAATSSRRALGLLDRAPGHKAEGRPCAPAGWNPRREEITTSYWHARTRTPPVQSDDLR